MNKKILATVIVCLLIIIGAYTYFIYLKKPIETEKVHYHAGFVVFQNNKKLDFSDSKYMYVEPCTSGAKESTDSHTIQLEKAHLHEDVGNLVHVEQPGALWKDLFTNMNYPIAYAKATGYINNKQVFDFQDHPIRPFDSLVVFMGTNDKTLLSQAVTKQQIIAEAKKSTTCGD